METTGTAGNHESTGSSVVIQQDVEEESSCKHHQTMMEVDSDFLKSLSPLINSMRPFGLYFARKPRVSCETAQLEQHQKPIRRCRGDWNFARTYATVLLVIPWLNAVRFFTIFDGKETLGAALFMKLAILPAALMNIAFQTSYYAASHTGSLDRVIRQSSFFASELSSKYSRRTKVVTAVCWLLMAWNVFHYIYQVFTRGQLNDVSLAFFNRTLPGVYLYIVKAVLFVLQVLTIATWLLPQAMNFMVMTLLCEQFSQLNKEFGKCVGDRGEFSGNFEQCRRRHQTITRSVQEADRFLMVSSSGVVVCQIVTIVLILYSTIFFRDDPVTSDQLSAVLNILWLSFGVCGLLLSAGPAIVLNHVAHKLSDRIHDIDLDRLDVKTVSEVNVFLSRLNGEPIGVCVFGIFVIDKNTILAVLGLLVTYFVLVVQFANPSSTCNNVSATTVVPTNCTCADVY